MLNKHFLIVLRQRKMEWNHSVLKLGLCSHPDNPLPLLVPPTGFIRKIILERQLLLLSLEWIKLLFSYLYSRELSAVPSGRSFCSSPGLVWWGASTPYISHTFISDVYVRVVCWDAFCFHRISSKNTTKLSCQGDDMKPKWYIRYLILKAQPSKNSVYSCKF